MKYVVFLWACMGVATEVDSFTLRDLAWKDARPVINQMMQNYFENALKKLTSSSCHLKDLEKALINELGGVLWAQIERDVENNPHIEKYRVPKKDSIYRDFNWVESPGMHVANLASLFRVDSFFIGSDKLGHFVQQGYDYYVMIHHQKKSILDVLMHGDYLETWYYGLATTGVYSYGDLAANYEGLFFWERVTNRSPFVEAPYFICEEGKGWEINPNTFFDILDYANESWDEAYNCSTYASDKMANKAAYQIAKTTSSCPLHTPICSKMIERYGGASYALITPACFY